MRTQYFVSFKAKLPNFTKPRLVEHKAIIHTKSDKKLGKGNVALYTEETGKPEIWLAKDGRNIRQLSRDTEHEMDHCWNAFIRELNDAYVDWKRDLLED